jgi:uncharacterized membrane protein
MGNRKTSRVTARHKWDRLKVSFWFAPAVMSLGAILLAWVIFWVDGLIPNEMLENSRLVLAGTPGELRSILISMAGTILATAGVVFTLLTLPLSTVAAQYGSRLLRVFLGDRITQLVLGMFVATFVYCIAGTLSIPPANVEPEGPQLTTTVGLFLMLVTFGSLILLVQHVSTMLQAPNIAAAAGAELRDVVLAEIPDEVRSGEALKGRFETIPDSLVQTDGYAVRVRGTGYIQYIDPETLFKLAREKNLVIRLLHKPGHFVQRNMAVALVWPAGPRQGKAGLRPVDEELEGEIRQAFGIGSVRTPTQDVAYAVNQLVEMAVRAMSAAINDPYTAMICLNYIGEGLGLFIRQEVKDPHYYDREGRLCLIFEPVTFEELLSGAFDMLRHCSCDNASVLQHMLEVIDTVGKEVNSSTVKNSVKAREELMRHVSLIQAESQAGKLIEQDRQLIQRSSEALLITLKEAS